MKKINLKTRLGLLLSLALLTLLLGCEASPIPVAANHDAHLQLKVQASEHWRDIASEVAERVLKAINDRPDLNGRPIFIASPNNRPFTVAFYNLLRSELVSRGLQVSYSKEPGGINLEYTVQTVHFDSGRRSDSTPLIGIDDKNRYNSPSNNEIIVNARLFHLNRFVVHCSAIRYINDDDWPLYMDPQVADPLAESSRNIRVTNR
ncbi:MAG: hypothetical protein LBV80_11375 [Deltaproteobacteria bacterium]|jgi:hypothetical protein|nr:hypothetical protein [Deltaproteobacteria bacterium]